MFFIDKYTPKKIEDIFFHKDKYEKLKVMSKDESIPHIIFYGPEGCGKKTMINLFLETLYDKSVHDLMDSTYNVNGSGNSTNQVIIKQSNYHIVIEPNNNNFDKYLIQDVVKEYARKMPLGVFSSEKIFKTVFINNIDNLSYYAQTSLRRTFEKYSSTCRFIMWSRSLSKVIDPLRSRCTCFGISSPSEMELLEFIVRTSIKEKIYLNYNQYNEILEKSEGNIKKALWFLELSSLNMTFNTTYDDVIKKIIKLLLLSNLEKIKDIREYVYNILITNIPGKEIIKDIIIAMIKNDNLSEICKINLIKIAESSETNLAQGRRDITHLEKFMVGVMNELRKYDY